NACPIRLRDGAKRVFAVAALAILASACVADLTIPPKAQITCAPDCPSGFKCTAAGRCVPESNLDVTAPLIQGTPTIDAPYVRLNGTFRVSFDVNESL